MRPVVLCVVRAAGITWTVENVISSKQPLYGVLFILISTLLFASHDGITKYLTLTYPAIMIIWARFAIQTVLTAGVFVPKMGARILYSKQYKIQLMRGVCMLMSSMFFVLGLRYVPVGEATSVVFLAPLIVTWYSGKVLGEKIQMGQWVAVTGGLLGVLIIVRPGSALFTPAILLPMAAAFAMAGFQILTRRVLTTDHMIATNFLTSLVCTVLLSVVVWYFWQTPGLGALSLMIIGSSLAMAGHLLLTHAYRLGSVASLAPFSYSQIIFATLIGFLFFGYTPDVATRVGMAIIMLSGAGLIWWQRR